MPSSEPPTAEPSPAEAPAPLPGKGNGPKQAKMKEPAAPTDTPKLSGADIKKAKQAEKAARRAQAIAEKGVSGGPPAVASPPQGQASKAEALKVPKGQHKRGGSTSVEVRNLPLRGGQKVAASVAMEPKKEDKTVELFRHLYKTRTTSIAGASKDVHPAVLALGLQMGNYTICGSCARLVATLQAFKRVRIFLYTVRSCLICWFLRLFWGALAG